MSPPLPNPPTAYQMPHSVAASCGSAGCSSHVNCTVAPDGCADHAHHLHLNNIWCPLQWQAKTAQGLLPAVHNTLTLTHTCMSCNYSTLPCSLLQLAAWECRIVTRHAGVCQCCCCAKTDTRNQLAAAPLWRYRWQVVICHLPPLAGLGGLSARSRCTAHKNCWGTSAPAAAQAIIQPRR